MNLHSSRSHMLLIVHVHGVNQLTNAVIRSELTLVDLAGSERIEKSGAKGETAKEAFSINKSLSALGDVIQALSEQQSYHPFTQREKRGREKEKNQVRSDQSNLGFHRVSEPYG
eukprot:TRINITY_DN824_c2_g1_i5.p1 TRINITY_DN824_c2_g1~~TRINITY_DN824_c2_g1_i5.p1  ORF type:complete len:114 (-),score=33.21 TRINITY_DN824_c2_g1_i5:57-398(-)